MNDYQNRRKEQRTPCSKHILINLGCGLRGRGMFIDVSPSGLLLRSDELFRLLNPNRHECLLDREIKIMLPAQELLARLVRVAPLNRALAARLAQISNLEEWLSLCQASIIE